ncbi:MAG: ubiquinol-cytochrome c reductase iron-sulfur subunit [Bacteroidota bacterium]|jgi:cytochrome b6-f complex iron-sulfur subunit|nr:Rieske (2Fe-2S) protein [Cytophagales bacterium]
MKRAQFIKIVGAGTVACACGQLVSCSSKGNDPTPSNIDFTLDLTQPANAALASNGGSIVQQGIIIVRASAGNFVAYLRACTHEGTGVNFQPSSNSFVCPNHGATFDISGNVTKGPATRALTRYNTSLSGTSLRVFS